MVVRKLGTEPPLPSCPGLDGRHGAGLIDIQLSEPRLALLQDACRIAPGLRPDVRGSEEHQRQVSSVVLEEGFVTNVLSITLCRAVTRPDYANWLRKDFLVQSVLRADKQSRPSLSSC